MAHIIADRIYDTTTTTGTGAITVSGTAPSSYRTFSAVMTTNDTCYYAIAHQTANEWEVGLGTYSAANQLTRTTIYSSSNAGNAVNFSAGTKDVVLTFAASRSIQLDNSANTIITSSAASALAVGRQGSTDPALKIDASTASSATGLQVKSAAAAGGVAVSAISSGSNEDLKIDAKGTGKIVLATTSTGNVGIFTASPTNALSLGGNSARTVWMERHTTSNTAGNNLTIQSGGATSGATDKAGGDLLLYSGTSTGTGTSKIQFYTATAGSTGTTDNAPSVKMTIDGAGNVGIGTSSPATKLYVSEGDCTVRRTSGKPIINIVSDQASGLQQPILELGRFGSGTTATPNGSYIGEIRWDGADSNNTYAQFGNIFVTIGTNAAGGAPSNMLFFTSSSGSGSTERMRIDSSGNVGIGTTTTNALLQLGAGTATANTAPLKFTSGTNLTTPEAGVIEYDGTIMSATPNTSFKRAAIPLTVYTSGAGTNLTTGSEATAQALFPSANDTITLPIGTYLLELVALITRGATSTTTATARINFGGGGTAVGSFSGQCTTAIAAGGGSTISLFNASTLTTDNVVTVTNATAAGVYNITMRGILKITTAGTIIPKYSLSANLSGATTATAPSALNFMILQSLDTQSAAAFGPAGCGWG